MSTRNIDILKQALESPYDKSRFAGLIGSLFSPELLQQDDRTLQGARIWEAFREHITHVERLYKVDDEYGERIDVLAVKLRNAEQISSARTLQRNFVIHWLKHGSKTRNAALVAFYHPEALTWRFSLVSIVSDVFQGARGYQIRESFVRRSFLVGDGEPSHTAQSQLRVLLERPDLTNLERLREAFDVEPVGKKFFKEYKEHFTELCEILGQAREENDALKAEFESKGISSELFARRLLGQLTFVVFLQKKGWLGVEEGETWGSGPTTYLYDLQAGREVPHENFYKDILEPLFYEGFAVDRSLQRDLFPALRKRIPFLNGGLFEPLKGYDWQALSLELSNSFFDKLFATFKSYNFTVQEDMPLEREVAIDPEMLGKLFEDMLNDEERSQEGTFYTPREVVHYMCQESLLLYLNRNLNGHREAINAPPQQDMFSHSEGQLSLTTEIEDLQIPEHELRAFLQISSQITEYEEIAAARIAASQKTDKYEPLVPPNIRKHAKLIDELLADIRVCDPAIGSGAFPVGMMLEIVHARQALTPHLKLLGEVNGRSAYELKRQAIAQSIFGIDISPGAVEIARLRLWLSLIVDEQAPTNIQPLPNLEYKIVEGNALTRLKVLVDAENLCDLPELKEQFFNETDSANKDSLHRRIKQKEQATYESARARGSKTNFDIHIAFSEILSQSSQKKGFDIVIANPPYVRQERLKEMKPQLKADFPGLYLGTADLYTYFYATAVQLLSVGGVLAFISSNKFFRRLYGSKIREHLSGLCDVSQVIDFGDSPIFEAIAYPTIVIAQKRLAMQNISASNNLVRSLIWPPKNAPNDTSNLAFALQEDGFDLPQKLLSEDGWWLHTPPVQSLFNKLQAEGTPLGELVNNKFNCGIKTGFNRAFIVDQETCEKLIKQDSSSQEILRPFLKGEDVKRWVVAESTKFLVNIPSSANVRHPWTDLPEEEAEAVFASTYPAIYDHFDNHRERLQNRSDQGRYFWELRSCTYYHDFHKNKIFYKEISTHQWLAWDEEQFFANNKAFIIPGVTKYILGVMNAKITWFFLEKIAAIMQGGALALQLPYISKIPIPQASQEEQARIERVVTQIIGIKQKDPQKDVSTLEILLDSLVFDLFKLSDEEISLVREELRDDTMDSFWRSRARAREGQKETPVTQVMEQLSFLCGDGDDSSEIKAFLEAEAEQGGN